MKIPNGEQAQLGDKLERYCLNLQHSKGRDKAAMFKNKLGITLDNKAILEQALLKFLIKNEANIYKVDRYGIQYDVKFILTTEVGSSLVLGCWIIRKSEKFPRLTNTYPVNK